VRRYGRRSPSKPPGRWRGLWFNVGPHAPSSADLSPPDQTCSEKLSRGKCSTQKKSSLRAAQPRGPKQRRLDVASARRLKGPQPPAPAGARLRVAAREESTFQGRPDRGGVGGGAARGSTVARRSRTASGTASGRRAPDSTPATTSPPASSPGSSTSFGSRSRARSTGCCRRWSSTPRAITTRRTRPAACFGRFDRPWPPERKIFGAVRYMSSENTAASSTSSRTARTSSGCRRS
jgi:hypothetical protein